MGIILLSHVLEVPGKNHGCQNNNSIEEGGIDEEEQGFCKGRGTTNGCLP